MKKKDKKSKTIFFLAFVILFVLVIGIFGTFNSFKSLIEYNKVKDINQNLDEIIFDSQENLDENILDYCLGQKNLEQICFYFAAIKTKNSQWCSNIDFNSSAELKKEIIAKQNCIQRTKILSKVDLNSSDEPIIVSLYSDNLTINQYNPTILIGTKNNFDRNLVISVKLDCIECKNNTYFTKVFFLNKINTTDIFESKIDYSVLNLQNQFQLTFYSYYFDEITNEKIDVLSFQKNLTIIRK